jgi:hypothetical protein
MKNPKLTDYEFLELSEYTHEERLELCVWAIEDMSSKGLIDPSTAKHWLENIDKWLREEFDN